MYTYFIAIAYTVYFHLVLISQYLIPVSILFWGLEYAETESGVPFTRD